MLKIRETDKSDLVGLLILYKQLHNNPMPQINAEIMKIWDDIRLDKQHHIIVGCIDDIIVSSCVLVIIPNLTHNQRPYAVVENVITDENYRGKGFATAVLNYAKNVAEKEHCYKIMLMTGSKKESTFNFYERAGYNRQDKLAFIQWLA